MESMLLGLARRTSRSISLFSDASPRAMDPNRPTRVAPFALQISTSFRASKGYVAIGGTLAWCCREGWAGCRMQGDDGDGRPRRQPSRHARAPVGTPRLRSSPVEVSSLTALDHNQRMFIQEVLA